MNIQVSKKLLAQALGLVKLSTSSLSQHVDSLDHALVRVYSGSLKISSTNDAIGSEVTLDLAQDLPELVDDATAFLVKPGPLLDLLNHETEDVTSLILDQKKSSISAKIGTATLHLPVKSVGEWPDIDARFISETEEQQVHTSILKELIGFNKFFMSGNQDPSLSMIELRGSLGISSDRTKFGFFNSTDIDGLEVRFPGEQLAPLEQALNHFPLMLSISSSPAYTLLKAESLGLCMSFGICKTNYMLGLGLDGVPYFQESESILLDRKLLVAALIRLSSVSIKVGARVKLVISGKESGAKIVLYTANELGQESTDTVSVNRAKGDFATPVHVIVPLTVFLKLLKGLTSDNVLLNLETKTPKYIKIIENRGHATTVSVFQSLPSLRT